MLTNDNPYRGTLAPMLKNVQVNYQKMKRIVLSEGYKKVFIVESDMIIPENALEKLLEVDAPVVSGLYAMRHGEPQPNVMESIGRSMSWSQISQHKDEIIQCTGGCTGCLLIDSEVLKGFDFEIEGWNIAPDGPFMQYCVENRIEQMARLDVQCGHKTPTGKILWPKDFLN